MKKILILEDNKAHQKLLKNLIMELPEKTSVYTSNSVGEAYKIIMENDINLFLIDIILDTSIYGDISGLRFMQAVREIPKYSFTPLIFITKLEDPMLFSYKVLHCYYFIEKPYDKHHLTNLIRQALTFPILETTRKNIFFRIDGIIYSVIKNDILYIESCHRKIRVHTHEDIYTIPYTALSKMYKELNSPNFIRCSRYFIVNKNHIEKIDLTNRYIKLKGVPELIEIGEIMKKQVRDSLLN